jgi:hypothetical protein
MNERKDDREYGYEGEMAMSQLKGIMMHAKQLHDIMEPDTDLPEWVQKKLTLAYDYIQTAADYMATEMSEEAPANVVGSGNIAGMGVGTQGEPGVGRRAMSRYKRKNAADAPDPIITNMQRRKSLSQFIKGE